MCLLAWPNRVDRGCLASSRESPAILSREIYATAALAGAVVSVLLSGAGVPRETAIATGFVVAVAIRFGAMHWNWLLPRYGRPSGDP